ncbi:hypothetical protein O3P69_003508 [Scylla paramamosain]|uniref:Uncharacterized protein n=1 Tax=Scylla paramamosain TaxID=85552 RepID=A0AAW0UIY4_SCYPA
MTSQWRQRRPFPVGNPRPYHLRPVARREEEEEEEEEGMVVVMVVVRVDWESGTAGGKLFSFYGP